MTAYKDGTVEAFSRLCLSSCLSGVMAASLAEGAVSVVTDVVSQSALKHVLQLTTQHDIVLVISLEVLVLVMLVEALLLHLTHKWSKSSTNPCPEDRLYHVMLRFVSLVKFGVILIVLRMLTDLTRSLLPTSHLPWNDALVVVFLLLALLFILIERSLSESSAHTIG